MAWKLSTGSIATKPVTTTTTMPATTTSSTSTAATTPKVDGFDSSSIASLGMGGLQFYKDRFDELKGERQNIANTANTATNSQLASQDALSSAGTAGLDRVAQNFNPVTDKIAANALAMDGGAEGQRLAEQAKANSLATLQGQQDDANRKLQAMGIKPGSGRSAMVNADLDAVGAALTADAMTKGYAAGEELANTRLQQAAALGNQLTSQANSQLQTAGTLGTAATQNSLAPSADARADSALVGTGLNTAIGAMTQQVAAAQNEEAIKNNATNAAANLALQQQNAQQKTDAANASAWGSLLSSGASLYKSIWG